MLPAAGRFRPADPRKLVVGRQHIICNARVVQSLCGDESPGPRFDPVTIRRVWFLRVSDSRGAWWHAQWDFVARSVGLRGRLSGTGHGDPVLLCESGLELLFILGRVSDLLFCSWACVGRVCSTKRGTFLGSQYVCGEWGDAKADRRC